MRKGFTLIELLAVIIVLALIALITTPIVLKVVDNAKEKSNEQSIRGYANAVGYKRIEELFKENIVNDNDLTNLSIETKGNKVNCTIIKFDASQGLILYDCDLENSRDKYCLINDEVLKNEACDSLKPKYKDNSGANAPDLLTKMIPIKYDGINWIYASEKEKWYDYEEKEWANAVVLNSGVTKNIGDIIEEEDIALWYVWIPRYKYLVFNGNNESITEQVIDITFESNTSTTGTVMCHDAINGTDSDGNKISEICIDSTQTNNKIVNNVSTYTHPAFCLGTKNEDGSCNGDELTGFWFGKFDVSIEENNIKIKPNSTILSWLNIQQFFTSIKNINEIYEINGDSHMAKNMEWGAVSYLKQSKYGLGITNIGLNNYYNGEENVSDWLMMTGCGNESESTPTTICNTYNTEKGMLSSTTGNIYGVYDMSGGDTNFVMGNMVNESGEFNSSLSGFTTAPDSKYYDAYSYGSGTYEGGKLGDATKETKGWYKDLDTFPSSDPSWFGRAGGFIAADDSGVFTFGCTRGDIISYGGIEIGATARAVLSN